MSDSQIQGVTVQDMLDYLKIDDTDDNILRNMIDAAEADAQGAIDRSIPLDTYRGYPMFNQAVRVLVDFNYFNRGQLGVQMSYPPSYQYMLNSIRFKITSDNGGDTNGV